MNVLVLGIGNAQVDLLQNLTGKHRLHALSYTSRGRGKIFADYFEKIDIKDKKAVLTYARKHSIDLVYSIGSDLAMVTSAWVSEKLQLPTFISPEIADICHTKSLLRKHLGDLTGNIAYKVLSQPDDIGDFEYPCIIKPVDSQGQRGVFLVHNKDELTNKFEHSLKFSESNSIMAETYIEGPEISVNAYLIDGFIHFFVISDRIAWSELPGGIIHKHRIPSQFKTKSIKPLIRKLVIEVTNKVGIKNGPVYFQIKMKDNKPKLIEVTPRLDGCHLWKLIKFATGVDLLQTSVDHLINNNTSALIPEVPNESWFLEFMCQEPKTIMNRDKFNLDDAIYHEWYYNNGERIKPMNGYKEKCGYQIYKT